MKADTGGPWLTLTEAAGATGLSVDTIRRKAKEGRLPAQKVAGKSVPEWRVQLPEQVLSPDLREFFGQIPQIRRHILALMRQLDELEALLRQVVLSEL